MKTLTDADVSRVLALLRFAPHGMSREELAERSGLSDRKVRACLRRIDLDPDVLEAVVPCQAGGYRLVRTPEDCDAAIAPLASRVARLGERIEALKKLRELLGEDSGQLRLPPCTAGCAGSRDAAKDRTGGSVGAAGAGPPRQRRA